MLIMARPETNKYIAKSSTWDYDCYQEIQQFYHAKYETWIASIDNPIIERQFQDYTLKFKAALSRKVYLRSRMNMEE